ncbi:MAG: hypothetical protein IPM56_16235 [Ignavibacteriales bacterium]|nr:MAG: hypothetical protein IPM56_16235 [Ignavibacteriales bacterium]
MNTVKSFVALLLLLLTLFVIVMVAGCSTQKDIIRDKKVTLAVPPLRVVLQEIKPVNVDSLIQHVIDSLATDSTYYEAEKVTQKGDSVKIKFYLKSKDTGKPSIEVDVKQVPVDTTYADTTSVVKENKPFTDYLLGVGAFVLIIGMIIFFIKRKL